jgi:hypothetical protein
MTWVAAATSAAANNRRFMRYLLAVSLGFKTQKMKSIGCNLCDVLTGNHIPAILDQVMQL